MTPILNAAARKHRPARILDRAVMQLSARSYDEKFNRLYDLSGNGLHAVLGTGGNAPRRLQWTGQNEVHFPGLSGNYVSSPKYIPGAGVFRVEVSATPDSYTPSAAQRLDGVYTTTSDQRSWVVDLNTDGTLRVLLSSLGTSATLQTIASSVALPSGTQHWAYQVDLVGGTVDFATSPDGTTWSALGTQQSFTPITLFDSSATRGIGASNAGTASLFTGNIRRLRLLFNGVAVRDFDPRLAIEPYATVTAATAEVYTFNRASSGRKIAVIDRDLWLLGTDDFLEVTDHPLLNYGYNQDFTWVVLMRQYATPPNFGRIMSKNVTNSTNAGVALDHSGTSMKTLMQICDAAPTAVSKESVSAFSVGFASLVGGGRIAGRLVFAIEPNGVISLGGALANPITGAGNLFICRRSDAATFCDYEFIGAAAFRTALSAADAVRVRGELLT
jgi:hypothetical protein